MLDFVEKNFGAILTLVITGVGLVAWFVRLEGRATTNKESLGEKIADNRERISKLEGQMETLAMTLSSVSNDIGIIRNDIKWIRDKLKLNTPQ